MIDLSQLVEGLNLPEYKKEKVTKVQLVKYAGASGDFNPLHTDDAFAQKIGLNGVIAHGMLIMGFLGEYVNKIVSNEGTVTDFKMRFGAMTVPEDEIVCKGIVKEKTKIDGRTEVVLKLYAVKDIGEVVGSGETIIQF
ncbi:MaoC/PaaZ C-terminal domain-containing protein [Solibacillus sp. FSL K6-1126]|uniref:MaoC/PaaZ C-terminal domain-containing protein n=1 Tax=Solibacillus sp. FSL K6-1126 TaxID=2921463 RepID=UPI0030FCD606